MSTSGVASLDNSRVDRISHLRPGLDLFLRQAEMWRYGKPQDKIYTDQDKAHDHKGSDLTDQGSDAAG